MILGISTSSTLFEVIIGDDSKILFSDSYTLSLTDKKDISFLVSECLAKVGIAAKDLTGVVVDVGPGGTSLVRTGVAFGNGLAYSLKIPICPVLSVEIVGIQVQQTLKLPVVITVKSIKDTAYVALFDGKLLTMKYGVMTDVVAELTADISEYAVAGAHREKIIESFPNKRIHDSGLLNGNARLLIEKHDFFKEKYVSFPYFAHPITEQSAHLAGQ
jgi:tRNA A37 threonylcarbamoyladenosine modification protein TsaB